MTGTQTDIFEVKLPLFEGPFDLLLFFIERDELNIYDIPIADITGEFLDYVHELEKLNIDLASEFIVVAATLMRIKSKMLLPRKELNEEGQEIDPREDLIKHLLEYKRMKEVVPQLAHLEYERMQMLPRGNAKDEIKELAGRQTVELEMQHLDMYKLYKVYNKVMKRYANEQNQPIHSIVPYPYTIAGQKEWLTNRLKAGKKLSFEEMAGISPGRVFVVFNFLAILEMLQSKLIIITIGEGFNNFWIQQRSVNPDR